MGTCIHVPSRHHPRLPAFADRSGPPCTCGAKGDRYSAFGLGASAADGTVHDSLNRRPRPGRGGHQDVLPRPLSAAPRPGCRRWDARGPGAQRRGVRAGDPRAHRLARRAELAFDQAEQHCGAALLFALFDVTIKKSLHSGVSDRGLTQQRPDPRFVQSDVRLNSVPQEGGQTFAWVWSPIWGMANDAHAAAADARGLANGLNRT